MLEKVSKSVSAWLPITLFAILFLSLGAFAQEAADAAKEVVAAGADAVKTAVEVAPPTAAEIGKFLEALGGVKGAGTLAIVAIVVQGLMLVMKTALGKMAGIWQVIILNLLTLIGGVIALKMSGSDWASALLHSQSLAAFQVFLHQLWKQFGKKAADQAAA